MLIMNDMGEFVDNFDAYKPIKLKPCHPSCMHIPPEQPKRKRCKECRKLFKPNSERQIYCNSKCGARYRRRYKKQSE